VLVSRKNLENLFLFVVLGYIIFFLVYRKFNHLILNRPYLIHVKPDNKLT